MLLFVLAHLIAVSALSAFDYRTRRLTDSGPNAHFTPLFSSEGEWLVYTAAQQAESARHLYSTRRWVGSVATRLSPDLGEGWEIDHFQLSLDERFVAFTLRGPTGAGTKLFRASLRGATASGVELAAAPSTTRIEPIDLSPDGSRVLFIRARELWSVPGDGSGPPVRVNAPLAPDQEVVVFWIAPGGERVVFRVERHTHIDDALWSAPVDASTPAARLSPPTSLSGVFGDPGMVGQQVVFRGDFVAGDGAEVWNAPVAGGAPAVRISAPFPIEAQGLFFTPAPGGGRTVFAVDSTGLQDWEIFRSANTGPPGATIRLSHELEQGAQASHHRFSRDGARVLYRVDRPAVDQDWVYSVPLLGFPPVQTRLTPDGPSRILDYVDSQDGEWLIYEDQPFFPLKASLWSVPLAGPPGSAVRLSPDDPDLEVQAEFQPIQQGNGRVVFSTDRLSRRELWSAPIDGSSPAIRLHAPIDFTGGVLGDSTRLSASGDRVYFHTNTEVVGPEGAWVVPIGGPAEAAQRLHPEPPPNGDFSGQWLVSPEGVGVMFVGDLEVDGINDLWLADEMIFGADFDEEGDLSEWSVAVP